MNGERNVPFLVDYEVRSMFHFIIHERVNVICEEKNKKNIY